MADEQDRQNLRSARRGADQQARQSAYDRQREEERQERILERRGLTEEAREEERIAKEEAVEERAREEEFNRQQKQARDNSYSAIKNLKSRASQAVKEKVVKQARKGWGRLFGAGSEAGGAAAAGGGGVAAAGEGAAAAGALAGGGGEILAIILAIILIILLIIGIIGFFISVIVGACNASGSSGIVTRGLSTVASWVGYLPGDVCSHLSMENFSGGAFGGAGSSGSFCTDEEIAALPAKYGNPAGSVNAPELVTLMSCIESNSTLLTAMSTAGISGLGEVSTFDKSNPTCNLTRGNLECTTKCSHSVNSCHYGGQSGTGGALAVDYGLGSGAGGDIAVIGNDVISAALSCGAKSARCENENGVTISCSDASATHVHVTSASCDRN